MRLTPPARHVRSLLAAFVFASSTFAGVTSTSQTGPIEFGAAELRAALALLASSAPSAPEPTIVLALADSPEAQRAFATREISPAVTLRSEGFSLRVARPVTGHAARTIWIVGADAAGVMYGSLELAEIIRTRRLDTFTAFDRNPHFAERGVKFNIPLDVRSPSYTDAGESAQQNIATVWDITFWRDYIDRLARDRYNLVSLWNLHPFPSLVRVPEYPDIALADVQRSTTTWKEYYHTWATGLDAPEILNNVETLKRLTIEEKIAFWREVMRYGLSRNVKFYLVTWNVFVNGTAGKYGLTPSLDNATTADYFRRSVRELLLTYPDLAGIGLTTGENMPDATAAQKEDWAFRTYGQGVLDAAALQPGRKMTFIHRQHEAGAAEIARRFAPLIAHPDIEFVYSFKYAEAHALSSTKQNFHEKFLQDVRDQPVLWTLRNDDAYYFRWGAPDFVREFIRNMPTRTTRGFYYGSDQWIWGRDFLDRHRAEDAPRPLEHEKHWFHWLLWGRLGYDPSLSNDRLAALLGECFQLEPAAAARLFAAWQDASMIYPLTTGFHWGRFDFQWYIEGSKSRPEPARTPTGFHDINRFISLAPHPATDNLSIPDYIAALREKEALRSTTPLQLADRIEAHADRAFTFLEGSGGRPDRHVGATFASGPSDLARTLDDIRIVAHLGKHYAHKIRAATALALFRDTLDATHRSSVAAELNAAAHHWRTYASLALTHYKNPVWMNRVGRVDWRDLYSAVLYDLTTTGSAIAVPSITPSPGGIILEAEDARAGTAPIRNTSPGFTGAGYRDFSGSQGLRSIEWTFEAPTAGRYILEFRYAMRRQETADAALFLNDTPVAPLTLWPTGGIESWAWDRVVIKLRPGANTIRLHPPLGPNIDHLNILPLD